MSSMSSGDCKVRVLIDWFGQWCDSEMLTIFSELAKYGMKYQNWGRLALRERARERICSRGFGSSGDGCGRIVVGAGAIATWEPWSA